MKYCLNCRVASQYLKQADQIKVHPRDIKYIYTLFEQYPDKDIILIVNDPPVEEDIAEYRRLNTLGRGHFILCFNFYPTGVEVLEECRWYANYPVESFSEANALIAMGSESLKVSGPLFFQVDRIAQLNTLIRLTPNRSYLSYVPRFDGICGQWIRPEDVSEYDRIPNAIIEFDACPSPEVEEALYRIYAIEHKWAGPLSYLVQDIKNDALNRLMPDGLTNSRLNCRQKCQRPDETCRICPSAFRIANGLDAKRHIDKT